jgi:hypothetical protein
MKYKVIIDSSRSEGGGDSTAFTFYTYNQALACCESWIESANKAAWLWDGSSWTFYGS